MKSKKIQPTKQNTYNQFVKYFRKEYMLYLIMVPGLLYFLLFKYVPMYGITIAFRDYNIFKGINASPWVGFTVFKQLFAQAEFQRALTNNIVISILKLVIGFPTPIIMSLMINEIINKHYKKVIQTAVILPNFISWVVVYGLLYAMFSPTAGAIKEVSQMVGYLGTIPNILNNPGTFTSVIVLTYVWKCAGMGTIVYLAAISGIDTQLYEAAAIDGAGKWKQLIHITLPSLKSTIVVLLLFRVGELMYAGFDQIFAITNPMVNGVADIIDTYVYRAGLQNQQFSLATAAGVFQSIIGLMLVLITNYVVRKIDRESALL
jgi:putative aldouronate transport system permease protein